MKKFQGLYLDSEVMELVRNGNMKLQWVMEQYGDGPYLHEPVMNFGFHWLVKMGL